MTNEPGQLCDRADRARQLRGANMSLKASGRGNHIPRTRSPHGVAWALASSLGVLLLGGCPGQQSSVTGKTNTTDKTNHGASSVGAAACTACHVEVPNGHADAGVDCESCHGPGSGHFTTADSAVQIDISRIFIDPDGAQTCNACHTRSTADASDVILAADGFILAQQQATELTASGGHATFNCGYCHEPHGSVTHDLAGAIRNDCTVCHTVQTMAGHGGDVFVSGDYTEALRCESCHMPFATRAASNAGADVVGVAGRMGDTRTHIFRIDTAPQDYTAFLSADGTQVNRDTEGRAAVTVDFVCLRCHNGLGNVFNLSVARAAEIAGRIHELP